MYLVNGYSYVWGLLYDNRAARQEQLNPSLYKSGYRPGVLICPAEHMGCRVCVEHVYMHVQLLHILHMNSLRLPHNALCSTGTSRFARFSCCSPIASACDDVQYKVYSTVQVAHHQSSLTLWTTHFPNIRSPWAPDNIHTHTTKILWYMYN